MRTVSEYGSCIVVNSQYTKDRVIEHFKRENIPLKNTGVSHLGNVIQEYSRGALEPPTAKVPYFVFLSTIEGRKNITHLFNVWRQIIHHYGYGAAPRLVIVGKRGWKCENVIDVLDRTRELAPCLVEVSGLTDIELASLMAGATGILSPSLVEGYSLPPIEGAKRHIPVIASDIAVHREILGDAAILLDPTDGPGWREAIMKLVHDPDFRNERVAATFDLPRISWDDFAADALSQAVELSSGEHIYAEGR
ncbi:glycosyltransferase [Ensifer sp. WSM1721]|uniref:glycosyltransferase n=1 Tax=Ensifer sp. WSM1721 TaxID=1041159 RepID=UPI0018DD5EAC|nr:glycosyltransferase [Ensifer sp. WSM1721]